MDLLKALHFTPQQTLEALKKLFHFTSQRRNKIANLAPLRFESEIEQTLSLLIDSTINEQIGISILDYGLSQEQIGLYSNVLQGMFNQVLETMPDEDFQATADVIEDAPLRSKEPSEVKPEIEYFVVTASSPLELSQKVTNYLKSGYTLGNFSVCDRYFAQVVTKDI